MSSWISRSVSGLGDLWISDGCISLSLASTSPIHHVCIATTTLNHLPSMHACTPRDDPAGRHHPLRGLGDLWTGGLALRSLSLPAHPALTAPEPPTHPPSTQPGLPTTRPPHMHKPSIVTGLQQFDPGGTVGCKAQNMHWYGGKIFLTFFAQITSYGFCNICATGQIPPFLLHEGSRHPRMRQYQNGRQRH